MPEKFFEFILNLMNTPLQWLLNFIKDLMIEPVNIILYESLWAIIIYIISLFYGLLIVYVGFNFMFSGHNVIKRENAKSWLKNVIAMIVLVQASYFLYYFVLQIGSYLTAGVMGLIDNQFFLLGASTFGSFGLEFVLTFCYLLALLATVFLLVIRYLCVGLGLIFFPLGIFFMFIPPFRGYGKFILNVAGIFIFMTFFQTIILLAASKLVLIPFFATMKILVMIGAFSVVNFSFFALLLFARTKTGNMGVNKGLRTIANLLVKLG